jgi:hypothetical protein
MKSLTPSRFSGIAPLRKRGAKEVKLVNQEKMLTEFIFSNTLPFGEG